MKTVTFCGHKEVNSAEDVKEWLRKTVESLILRDADTFLLGGYGGFDLMAADVVWEAKKSHPQITSVLVIPYIDRKFSSKKYDETLYPPLEKVPKRFAISKRNEWMVRQADVVVSYVLHSWGGAAKTLEYAERKKKEIIGYSEKKKPAGADLLTKARRGNIIG